MARYAAKSIIKRMLKGGVDVARCTVAVLGLTFKDNCPDVRNSKVVDLIRELESWNIKVKVVDPWADPDKVKAEYGINLVTKDRLVGLAAIVVAVGHEQFRTIDVEEFRSMCPADGAVFADLKSIYNKKMLIDAGYTVFRL